jgi:predicted AAA+ superfamily ATPase
VQLCPRARAAIKYLIEDGRYDYIETGSLVSINKNVKDIVIPSEERRLQMYPMDFEEFAWALGDEMLIPFIRLCFDNQKPLGPLMHRKAMDMFKEYMIVGGMPQAVCRYIESNKNFAEVDKVKRDILSLYKSDIEKYASGFETKVKSIFEQLPATLQRHEKKFRLQDIQSTARFREYETSFFWLEESQVINICWGATEPSLGLRMKMDTQQLKCYMADTGLLISLAFDEKTIVSEEIYKKLLLDKLEINKGMLVENIVAQMLRASGHRLYFYSQYSNTADDRMEIDFLIQKPTISNRHNISPIEVKSSTRYTLTSLGKFVKKYNSQLHVPYVIHYQDLKYENGIVFLPIYMTPFL